MGTVVGIIVMVAWVGLGALVARASYSALDQNAVAAQVLVSAIAIIFALGGLVIFWGIAEQIELWRQGYRVRQIGPKGFFRLSLGPKQCVYEERAPGGQILGLPFVLTVLGDGYPAPCEVCLPREEDWDARMPSWARGRRRKPARKKCLLAQASDARPKRFLAEIKRSRHIDEPREFRGGEIFINCTTLPSNSALH